jgi:hypothetical protein
MENVSDETPSKSLTATVSASHLDARNRLITVRRLNALQFYRLTKALGATASNPAAMDLAMVACTVFKIDATPIALPANEREVEFLIQQLDFDGIAAAGEALKKLSGDELESDAAKN